jgi:signal transduction histidine kinase
MRHWWRYSLTSRDPCPTDRATQGKFRPPGVLVNPKEPETGRMYDGPVPRTRVPLTAYAAAVAAVIVAAGTTFLIRDWMGTSVSVLFFPAIIITAMYGGYGPALLATMLSTAALAYLFVPPFFSFDIGSDDLIRLMVFAAVGVVTASLSSARARAEAAQRKAFMELQTTVVALRKVSGWPVFVDSSLATGARKLLAHAANVVGAREAMAMWEIEDEPWVYVAALSDTDGGVAKHPPTELTPMLAPSLAQMTFVSADPFGPDMRVTVSDGRAVSSWRGMPVHAAIAGRLQGGGVASARFEVEHVSGRAFFSGLDVTAPELIPLVDVVAREVGNSLDHMYLHDRLQQIAIREDRIRLARDLHDGVLQSLTGIRLQLQTLADEQSAPSPLSDRLLAVERAIAIEQRELRLFIDDLKPEARRAGVVSPLAQRLEELRSRLAVEWKTPISVRVDPPGLGLPPTSDQAVRLMIREAVVNALKHAQPSRIGVEVTADGDATLRVVVINDGRGFPFRGRLDHDTLVATNAGPASLRDRVISLGGRLDIESTPTGSRLEITLPVAVTHSDFRTPNPVPNPEPSR